MRPIDADYIRGALEAELWRENDDLEDRQWAYGYAAGVYFAIRKLAETPTLTPPNEPLTLEELLRMDGAPVWLDVAGGMWALVDALDGCLWLDRGGSIDIAKFSGKAYRRPPEGEEAT